MLWLNKSMPGEQYNRVLDGIKPSPSLDDRRIVIGRPSDAGAAIGAQIRRGFQTQSQPRRSQNFPLRQNSSPARTTAPRLRVSGGAWRELDRDARRIIKSDMVHGTDRDDVVSQYLGSI
jgi:hypothetical protein